MKTRPSLLAVLLALCCPLLSTAEPAQTSDATAPPPEAPAQAAAQAAPATVADGDHWASGAWTGTLEVPGASLRFQITLQVEAGTWTGTVDVPQQGVHGLGLEALRVEAETVSFELPGGAGNPRYEGTWTNGEIHGTFHQGGANLPLTFQRAGAGPSRSTAPPAPKRPQTPEPPFPYRSVETTYGHRVGGERVRLAATLTLPDVETHGEGPYPAVLLLTGSGLQDRDETILGHKPFLVLADHLTRAGIAVLRADDRGFGESTGPIDTATLSDFAEDAAIGLFDLMGRLNIDTRRIGILGHSEGGLVAPLAAQRFHEKYGVSVAFYIFLGAPSVPGDDLIVRQVERMNLAAGATPQLAQQNAAIQRQIFDLMEQEADEAVLRQKLIDLLAPYLGAEGAATQIEPLLSPWYRHFVSYDPTPALRQIQAPVLAINGSLDTQVDAEQNLTAIKAALEAAGNEDFTIYTSHGHNHLLQPAETGSPAEYAEIETTIAPEILDVITAWILERFGPDASSEGSDAEGSATGDDSADDG